jgi:aminopeptidase N
LNCFFIAVNAQSNIDVLHYRYEIDLNDKNDTIKGNAIIQVVSKEALTSATFNLSEIGINGKGMIVMYVTNWKTHNPITWRHENNKLTINEVHNKGDTISFAISYKGIPSDGLIISKDKYGERTFFADNWPNRAHNWIPCIDDPADKASFEFIITAPSHYRVISNGILTEETNLADNKKLTHWKEDTPLPTKIMAIGVADFAVKQFPDSPEDIPVTAWVYRRDSTNGFNDYSVAPAILKFLSGYIAPYPYKKLANVESKTIFGGMENASAIFYSEGTVTGKSEDESLMAHEITHQWFGDMATERSFAHLWLSEGFATYFAHIYIESKYGTDSLNKEMQKDRDEIIEFTKIWNKPVVDAVSPYMQLLNVNSYQKGSWVLHMLRRQLGDSVFHQIIRSYYDMYKGKNADTKDFENIAEKISGKNLTIFFRQWLYTPGLPHLKISWKYLPKEKKISIKIDQLQADLFQFPLDIAITGTKSKTEKLMISKKSETFILPVKDKPLKVFADPFTSLLFNGSVTQAK